MARELWNFTVPQIFWGLPITRVILSNFVACFLWCDLDFFFSWWISSYTVYPSWLLLKVTYTSLLRQNSKLTDLRPAWCANFEEIKATWRWKGWEEFQGCTCLLLNNYKRWIIDMVLRLIMSLEDRNKPHPSPSPSGRWKLFISAWTPTKNQEKCKLFSFKCLWFFLRYHRPLSMLHMYPFYSYFKVCTRIRPEVMASVTHVPHIVSVYTQSIVWLHLRVVVNMTRWQDIYLIKDSSKGWNLLLLNNDWVFVVVHESISSCFGLVNHGFRLMMYQ